MSPLRILSLVSILLAGAATPALAGKSRSTATTTTTTSPTTTTSTTTSPTTTTTTTTTSTDWILQAPSATVEPRPFAATSFWNTVLPADQPVDAASDSLAGDLVRQVNTYGPWINTTQYTTPVYTVGASQPLVPVILDAYTPSLKAAFAAGVPLPGNATGSAGTDGTAVVWQPSSDTYWEFWQLHKMSDGWHARWGGVMNNASQSSGVFEPGFGTAASGLALLGGLIRPGEFSNWTINHVMRMGLPEVTAGVIRAPANRTDGKATGGIPMGTRFQLDPSLDVWSLNVPLATKIIAYAAQRYGVIVGDSSGAVTLYGEDPLTMTSNPWPSMFSGLSASQVMRPFPWSRMRALPPTA